MMFDRYSFFLCIVSDVSICLLCSASCYPADKRDLTSGSDTPVSLNNNRLSSRNYNSISNDNSDLQQTSADYVSPTCSFNFGNNLTVDCSRFTVGDTVVTFQVNGNSTSTIFYMTLINSTSANPNNFFQISPATGQIFLQRIPYVGKVTENYSVSAVHPAGQSCPLQTLTLTTTETCVKTGPHGIQ